ncbi:hypothetical protein ACS0Y6_14130, partial [Burkholderia gladioli]|uniref:hypothetical protein n=1 Tax=Burkholderia gladioli TaxID=28095 RepID=UPI003F79D552
MKPIALDAKPPPAVFSRGRHRAVTSEPRRIWPRPVRADAAEASIHAIHPPCRRKMKCFVHEKTITTKAFLPTIVIRSSCLRHRQDSARAGRARPR